MPIPREDRTSLEGARPRKLELRRIMGRGKTHLGCGSLKFYKHRRELAWSQSSLEWFATVLYRRILHIFPFGASTLPVRPLIGLLV